MSFKQHNQTPKLSRRQFLAAVAKGAVALGVPVLLGSRPAHAQQSRPKRFVIAEDRFGRMFSELPPFAEPSNKLEAALLELGKRGGILDAKDALDRSPVDLIVDLTLSANNRNNGTHTAGTTFMGQFIDHDITFDLTSRLGQATDPAVSPNFRTPGLDLDSVYGGGPHATPELYEEFTRGRRSERGIKLKIESGGAFEDLPRQGNTAIIADPRNDENVIIAGLHAAFLRFHNNVVDLLMKNPGDVTTNNEMTAVAGGSRPVPSSQELFGKARRLTTWHYQWMVVHEFLPLFVGQAIVDDILNNGRKFYRPEVAQIPVEFMGAAYRFGHSMVRPSYRANFTGINGEPFFGFSSTHRKKIIPTPTTCEAGSALGDATSAGKLFSISAMET